MSHRIDWTTLKTELFSGDAVNTTINLSSSLDNFDYLIFVIRSTLNDSAPNTLKLPTRKGVSLTTITADRWRYTLACTFLSANGSIGTDAVQYIGNNDGTQLTVKYQGFNYIGNNQSINVNQTSNIHVMKIYGTNYLV